MKCMNVRICCIDWKKDIFICYVFVSFNIIYSILEYDMYSVLNRVLRDIN